MRMLLIASYFSVFTACFSHYFPFDGRLFFLFQVFFFFGCCEFIMLFSQSCPTLCYPMESSPAGSSPLNSPGKNTGVGCDFLLQGLFLSQASNLGLLHCRQIYQMSHHECESESRSVEPPLDSINCNIS